MSNPAESSTTPGPLAPEALARLGSLPLAARVIVEGALSGMHRAKLHGSSVEFAEHRLYTPGDELRHIDWKAYGKHGRYYIKQFDQESQLTTYLVLDSSASMSFVGGGARKLDYAAWLLAALAYLVIGQNDKVGLVTFGNAATNTEVPARGRTTHLQDLLAAITRVTTVGAQGNQGLAGALNRVAELSRRRRALIFVASDLFDNDDTALATLRSMRARGHDVAVFHVLDPHELTFPYDGLTRFEALETDHSMLANPAAIRAGYLERMAAFVARCESELTSGGVDYVKVTTDQALDVALRQLLQRRATGGARANVVGNSSDEASR